MEKIKIEKGVFRKIFQFGYTTAVSGYDFFEEEVSSRLPNHMTRLDAEAQVTSEIAYRIMDIAGDFGFDLIDIPLEKNGPIDYYRFNYNLQVGDIVWFMEGAFDELNKSSWMKLNPEIATKSGIVRECRCEIDAWANGSAWVCKVDFDGDVIETMCGFFEKD